MLLCCFFLVVKVNFFMNVNEIIRDSKPLTDFNVITYKIDTTLWYIKIRNQWESKKLYVRFVVIYILYTPESYINKRRAKKLLRKSTKKILNNREWWRLYGNASNDKFMIYRYIHTYSIACIRNIGKIFSAFSNWNIGKNIPVHKFFFICLMDGQRTINWCIHIHRIYVSLKR